MLIEGRVKRTEINVMHLKWEATWTHGHQPNTFQMGQRVKSYSEKKYLTSNPRYEK